ncbi:hypothetical protein PIB30_088428 [Stylosanthes scabra]|uniref:Uncharacterized protein n=1 Tax=Stylosanthes scabra TaxID=79078 RepID=A0ABU6XST3_9FABA|nr:hypothetical protein [Stylosanthes scabra]
MMWYQQQALENISKNQAEYMAELRDIKGKQQELYENNDKFYNQVRQEQKEMVQEIQQIKNYQVNQTLVDSTELIMLFEESGGKMKKGSLQSNKRSLEANLRKSSTHMHGRARICLLLKDLSTPRQLWPCLGVAPLVPLTTHRHGGPRICVES